MIYFMGLLKETLTTFWDNQRASWKYQNIIRTKLAKNENFHISPPIYLDEQFYRVARLGPNKVNFKTKEIIDFKGYLILEEKGSVIKDNELIKKILQVYEVWYYNYVHSIFSSLVYNFTSVIDIQIDTINDLEKSIQLRKNRGYEKEAKEFDEEYASLLEQLDEQVIQHNIHYRQELNYIKKFIETEKKYFEHLSTQNHNELFILASSIRMELLQENVVWLKRKEIWTKFIDKIKNVKKQKSKDIDIELIESITIDTITIPYPIPYAGTAYLLLKRQYNKALKKTKEWYYEEILKQKLGLEMIEQHIKDNVKLMEKLNVLNRILETVDYSKVRY